MCGSGGELQCLPHLCRPLKREFCCSQFLVTIAVPTATNAKRVNSEFRTLLCRYISPCAKPPRHAALLGRISLTHRKWPGGRSCVEPTAL